jgi:hypothetical protein
MPKTMTPSQVMKQLEAQGYVRDGASAARVGILADE